MFHTEEIVIKPMSSRLRHIAAFSGTTILGDGTVIMILDPNGIAQALGRAAALAPSEQADVDDGADARNEDLTSLLVFRAGSQQPKAVPLSLVARLEEIDCRRFEISNGRCLVQYRNQLMPLLRVDTQGGVKQDGTQPILVFSNNDRCMGLIVDEIVDIVEQRLDIEVASERPGVLGYAVVKGSATEIIDLGHFLPQAYADWFHRRDARLAPLTRKVMLVDNSAFFRDMLAPLIKAAGYQVITVASAAPGPRRDQIRCAGRPGGDRHRDAGHGRVRARRWRCAAIPPPPPFRLLRSRRWSQPTRSSAAGRWAFRILSPSSIDPD